MTSSEQYRANGLIPFNEAGMGHHMLVGKAPEGAGFLRREFTKAGSLGISAVAAAVAAVSIVTGRSLDMDS